MGKFEPNPGDPTTARPSPAPRPDDGDVTPPHGDRLPADDSVAGVRRDADETASRRSPDEVVNRQRNMSRHGTSPAADPDNDRPAD